MQFSMISVFSIPMDNSSETKDVKKKENIQNMSREIIS